MGMSCTTKLALGLILACAAALPGTVLAQGALAGLEPLQRRWALLDVFHEQDADRALPVLREALGDEALFVRRTAAHLMARLGRPAADGLGQALDNDDFEVRRIAARGLADLGLLPNFLGQLLRDEHRTVRYDVEQLLKATLAEDGDAADALLVQMAELYPAMPPPARQSILQLAAETAPDRRLTERVLLAAAKDDVVEVRETALRLLIARAEPGTEEGERVFAAATEESPAIREIAFQKRYEREMPLWDERGLELAEETDLPAAGWRFMRDDERTGHLKNWYEADADDGEWMKVAIEQFWHEFLDERYVGVGWYRRTVQAPQVPEGGILALHFLGVDECAWVWVNGRYAGQHNIGPMGWDVPFHLNVTGLIKPGEENQITIRAMNTAAAGGVWRPVRFQVWRR